MNKLLLLIFALILLIVFQTGSATATFSSGTYYLYEFGNCDYYSKQNGGDGTWTDEVQFIFDDSGNFTAQVIADSESNTEDFTGTYVVENGVLTLVNADETLSFRITPDGETLANVEATQNEGADIDNEALRILIKESNVSSISGTYYLYEFGNCDYYSKQVEGDGTWTDTVQFVFDGVGNFTAQILTDSESGNEDFTGTYTVDNGVVTLLNGDETLNFRITPDAETLANVETMQSEGPDIDNEALRILIKKSNVSNIEGTYYLYEFGNNDYYGKQDGGDGTWTGEVQFIFDGAGHFTAQILADSESGNEDFTGTYTVDNGILTLVKDDEILNFRITSDAETLANVEATQSEGPDIDNEALRILIKGSKAAELVDSDSDGLPDYYEYALGLSFDNSEDALLDKDCDGFSNLREYISGSNPESAQDLPELEYDYQLDGDVDGSDISEFAAGGLIDEQSLLFFSEDFGRK